MTDNPSTDAAAMVERLMATRPRSGRPYKSDAREFINPDGPEAAALIEQQQAEIERLRREMAQLPCQTIGNEGLEPGCCPPCRARAALTKDRT